MYTLMHISDLHRSGLDPISNAELLSGLVSDQGRYASENPAISQPDAIIVSGDLVQGLPLESHGYPEELKKQYDEAIELLIMFADSFTGGDRSRVIIVPGNHDVDWNKAFGAMERVEPPRTNIFKLLSALNSKYRWCWDRLQLFKINNRNAYEDRFKYFCEMYNRFYENTTLAFPLDPGRYWNLFKLNKGQIIVCAYNSCSNNDCFNYSGEIPYEAIAQSHLELTPHISPQSLQIAVWHHSTYGGPQQSDYMNNDTVRLMIDKGFRVGLHGHHHKSDAAPFSLFNSDRQTMALLSAGSLCAGYRDLPIGFNRQYNIIEINDDNCHARIHVREMQVPGVFSPGRLVALGGRSYADFEWTATTSSFLVNTGRSGGSLIGQVEQIEKLISISSYDDAVTQILDAGETLQPYSGRLLIKALFQAERWDDLVKYIKDPKNDEELALLIRATIALKNWVGGEEILIRAKETGQFSEAVMRELNNLFNVERRISNERLS